MKNKDILFITDHYIDKNVGGAKASRGFIKVFSELFNDVTLIYPDYSGSEIERFIPLNVKRIPCVDERSKLQKGIDVYRGRLHRYGKFVREHLLSNHYEVIVIDHSRIWSSLTTAFLQSGAKIITIHHNVEQYYFRDNPSAFYLRVPETHFALKAEKDAVINSDVNLTLTGKDKDELKKIYHNAKGAFYHLGALDYDVAEYRVSNNADANTFITTGALSFRQSYVPIIEFVNHYWPIVIEENPKAKLIIAGRGPSKELKNACAPWPSIELVSNPPDMMVYLNRAKYYICPINLGSGQKTRISDGLKSGIPVLCHEVSVYGYETVKDAGYIFSYSDEETFRESLRKMLSAHIDGKDVYASYSDFFSVGAGVRRLSGILDRENIL